MKRKQVFVRAQDETGKWGNADMLDLDEDSFRAVVLGVLVNAGALAGIRDEHCEGEKVPMRLKPGLRFERD